MRSLCRAAKARPFPLSAAVTNREPARQSEPETSPRQSRGGHGDRLRSPRREVPAVPLRVPGRILPLAVRLVCRRRIDRRSGASGVTKVGVYTVDEDNEAAGLCRQGPGRDQAMIRVDAMEPDHGVACGYLGVDRPTARISIESSSLESEDVHEEPLGGLYVVVHSQRNDKLGSHGRTTFPEIADASTGSQLFRSVSRWRTASRPRLVTEGNGRRTAIARLQIAARLFVPFTQQ